MKPLLYITPVRALLFGLTLALFELLTYLASDAVMPAMPVVVGDLDASPEFIPTPSTCTCWVGWCCNG
jgi:DHA1 family multidrug/chloramphenicol efflux transport protein-like MFS transporter